MQTETAEARYNKMQTERSTYERDGEEAAQLTIPSMYRRSKSKSEKIKTPYQATGAKAVNTLAAKLLAVLLPPEQSMFQLNLDTIQLAKEGQPEFSSEIDKALRTYETAVNNEIDISNDRVALFEALKHLIVIGNVLLYVGEKGIKVYHIDRFVCQRDDVGNVIEIISKETVHINAFDDEFIENLQQKANYDEEQMIDEEIDVYTRVVRNGDTHNWYQECKGERIPNTEGVSKVDVSPFIVLRWTRRDGMNYGESYVSEYRGDLISLEALMQAVIEAASASAKCLFLVNPNGVTRAATLSSAPNGAVREGLASDVSTLQVNKAADLSIAFQAIQRIESRLEHAFLMAKSVQRDAERVTSTEIQVMATELEQALGGIYSILSNEFQLPYIKRRIHMLVRSGKLQKLPDNLVKPKIVTGINGLGRNSDKARLIEFITTVAQALGGDILRQYMNLDEAIKRLATSVGIDTNNLVKSREEIEQEMQAMQQQQLVQSLGSAALGSKLADPKNVLQAQQLATEQANAEQNPEA